MGNSGILVFNSFFAFIQFVFNKFRSQDISAVLKEIHLILSVPDSIVYVHKNTTGKNVVNSLKLYDILRLI